MELLGLGVLLIGVTVMLVNCIQLIFMIQFMKDWKQFNKRLPKLADRALDITDKMFDSIEEDMD